MAGTGYVAGRRRAGSAIRRGPAASGPRCWPPPWWRMAFQPLRRWVVRLADRLAYGAAATPYEALADFSPPAGREPRPDLRCCPPSPTRPGRRCRPARTTVRLRVPGAADQVGRWPRRYRRHRTRRTRTGGAGPAGPPSSCPSSTAASRWARCTVEMPPGRALRQHDSRLLQDLADQSALAFRNARLSAELAHQVALLDRRTEELRRVAPPADHRRRRRAAPARAGDRPRGRARTWSRCPTRLDELAGSAAASRRWTRALCSRWSRRRPRRSRRCARSPGASSPPSSPAPGWRRRCARCSAGPGAAGWWSATRSPGDRLRRAGRGRGVLLRRRGGPRACPPRSRWRSTTATAGWPAARGAGRRDPAGCPVAPLRDRVETVGGTVVGRTGAGATVLEVRLPAAPRLGCRRDRARHAAAGAGPGRLGALAASPSLLAGVQTWLFLGWSVVREDASSWPVLTVGLTLWAALGAVIISRHPRHRVGVAVRPRGAAGPDRQLPVRLRLDRHQRPVPRPAGDLAVGGLGRHLPGRPRAVAVPQPALPALPDRAPALVDRWRPLLWATWASFVCLVVAFVAVVPPWQIDPEQPRRALRRRGGTRRWSPSCSFASLLVELLAAAALRGRPACGARAGSSGSSCAGWRSPRPWWRWASSWPRSCPGETGLLGWLRVLPLQLSVVAVGVGAGLAILRYRLYDLDLVVSRAILLTLSTAVVATGWTLLVVVVGRLLPTLGGRGLLAVPAGHRSGRAGLPAAAARRWSGSPTGSPTGRRAAPYEALADLGTQPAARARGRRPAAQRRRGRRRGHRRAGGDGGAGAARAATRWRPAAPGRPHRRDPTCRAASAPSSPCTTAASGWAGWRS